MSKNGKRRKRQKEPINLGNIKIPEHRAEALILEDLEEVCCSPGFAHALSFLCWRENFFGYDETVTPELLSHLSSEERLLRSELSLLTRLMVSAELDLTRPTPDAMQKQIDDVERLLQELHHTLNIPFFEQMRALGKDPSEANPGVTGAVMREPMFYSGEAAYHFQYRDFAVWRYNADRDWLKSTRGFKPEDVPVLYTAISDMQTREIVRLREVTTPETAHELTLLSAFRFTASQIAAHCGTPVEQLRGAIEAFSLKGHPIQEKYRKIGAWNQVSSYPIIPLDDGSFLLFLTYCLAESSYETPFFWMQQDKQYVNIAAANRGRFTEGFSAERLASVFGKKHVHRNVLMLDTSSDTIGEIDALVTYADRAIVLQAKSKKLTEAARRGSEDAIKSDLKKAVQDAYDQGFLCAERLLARDVEFRDEYGNTLATSHDLSEVFLLCVVADYFPGLPYLSEEFVSLNEHDVIRSPYIIDVFYLDVLCELLDNPLYFLSFLNRRSRYSKKVRSSSELAVLGFHLSQNLWFQKNAADRIQLGEEFSTHVDAAMLARRDDLPSDRVPKGILTHHEGTYFGSLIRQIAQLQQGRILDLGFLLLEASSDTARQVSKAIEVIFSRAKVSGGVHDFSLALGDSGMTIHCGLQSDRETYERLHAHCEIAKYRAKAASWFGLALSASKISEIRLTMGLHNEWKHDPRMDEAVRRFGAKPTRSLDKANWNQRKRVKIGVNQPCPCGSGKKYKKCCRSKDIF